MIRVTHGSTAAALLLVLSTPAFPSETLCSSSEEVVFSCQIQRGKTVSVCASSSNQRTAIIAYRFGTAKKIELELTADTSHESPSIEHNGTMGTRAFEYFVRFKSGEYTYTVLTRWDGCPWPGQTHCKKYSDFAGLLVYKSEKLIARRACTPSAGGGGTGIGTEQLSRWQVPVSEKWPEE